MTQRRCRFEFAHPVAGEPGVLCHLEDDAREHGDGHVEHAGGEAHRALELPLVRRVHAAPVPLYDGLSQLPANIIIVLFGELAFALIMASRGCLL